MATADPALLDARIRAAESTLASRYGRTLVEHAVVTPSGVEVRVVEYPAVAHAADAGPDAAALPPIVLLHGIASVNAVAMPLVGALPTRRLLAVDWPGHGLSGRAVLERGADLRAFVVEVLDAVVDAFGVEEVDLIGHSLGGQFALYFALRRRARVRRMVLLGAPGGGFGEVRPVAAMRVIAVPTLGTAILSLSTSQHAYRRRSERLVGRGALDGLPDEVTEIGYLASQRSDFAPSVASLFRTMMTPFGARPMIALSHDELATLAVPVLLVWGEDDVFLTPARGRASAEAIPGIDMQEVPGGHAPWLNDLDRVGLAVGSFLNR